MDLGIAGQVALVTGADSGIGFEVARQLSAEGVKVAMTDQNETTLARAAASLESEHVWYRQANVSRREDVDALARAVRGHFGMPQILVHCAGITGPTGIFHELSDDDCGWHST